MSQDTAILSDFFRTIWREEKGHVYLALKDPTKKPTEPGYWQRQFFEWPVDEMLVVQTVINERTSRDVYFAPAIFREPSSKKEMVLGTFCFWIEFDGSLPVDFGEVPTPSMIVQTSTDTHQHIYWSTDQFVKDVDKIEAVNKSLAYQLGADVSGWDANQVLRPPNTLNHKKKLQAKLVAKSDRVVNSVAITEKLVINLPPKIELAGPLPSIPEIVRKYQYTREVWDLFTKGVQKDRSAGLMALGYSLAEMNLTNAEIFTLLIDADNRWGKFSRRDDQYKRLLEIVTRARIKYPYSTGKQPESQIITVGLKTLLSEEVKVEWMWDGLLIKGGYLLLTGPTGIGKSQLSLDFAAHLALGKEFLGRSIDRPRKTAFVSLEMGVLELQYILGNQAQGYSSEDLFNLEKMLRFERRGYPVYFNRLENKLLLEEMIQREGIECVIFDSLGSMTEQELSKETDAKNLMDWNDHLRAELGISTLIIHHHRKAQTGNKRPNSISDIYGSHYFTARATTVLILWESRKDGVIEVNPRKVRMSAPIKSFGIKRRDDLTFELTHDKIEIIDDTLDIRDGVSTPDPTDAFEL